ncbi:GHKL domain-containing protein [Candidatus Izimaplasma bacterium ZiA1]|uniref:sensor histidine kinase n=1 Tax=Candidatus Izimoplasma sp. ZiA1 TaxID=2024899 RepID=UPI001F0B69A6
MLYLSLLPLILIGVYGAYLISRNYGNHTYWLALIIIVLMTLTYFITNNYNITSVVILYIFTIESILIFIVLHIKNKVSFVFMGFYISLSISILILGINFSDVAFYLLYISAMIFFIAEDNQLFMKNSYEEAATKFQNKILDKQVSEVQNIYLTMRGWRHDYHNHLQSLKAQISMGKIKEASTYLNDLEVDLDNVNQLVESGNVNLDAILNSKISLAIKNDIEVNYKAVVPKKLTVSDIDLCVLIGNLIDNAVEANEKIKDIPKFIRVYIGIFKKQLYISVSNATNEVVKKMDEEYISTKRGNHGHGLKRINLIVNKYDGYLNRKNEPGVFVTEVLLPL